MEGLGCEYWRRIRSGKARSKVRMISPRPSGRADWTGPKAGDALAVEYQIFWNFPKWESLKKLDLWMRGRTQSKDTLSLFIVHRTMHTVTTCSCLGLFTERRGKCKSLNDCLASEKTSHVSTPCATSHVCFYNGQENMVQPTINSVWYFLAINS